MQSKPTSPPIPTGKIKILGPDGPAYEVGQTVRPLEDGDWMVEITLVESGEKTEHRLAQVLSDPEAS